MITFDFETKAIEERPAYPPKPVGLAVRYPDGGKRYISWGHPSGNTGSRQTAYDVLTLSWDSPMLFHNGAFDIAVAVKEFGLPWPKNPLFIHDTTFLLFLFDPNAQNLKLKPSSERILGLPPEEQDELELYIRQNINNSVEWGAYIADAPAEKVAPYAISDVDRTFLLFDHLHPIIVQEGMEPAYKREQLLMPILERASQRGVRVNPNIVYDLPKYEDALVKCNEWMYKKLGKEVNLDSNIELADALDEAGLASGWLLTPKGRRSVSQESLAVAVTCLDTRRVLAYRGAVGTCLSTFMRPWVRSTTSGDGRLHPGWNQVKGSKFGARTGRLSSNGPNFMNIPNEFEQEVPDWLPPLPLMRQYVQPEEGHVWLKRDFASQEVRGLAHYEDGPLMAAYQANRRLDPHAFAQDMIRERTGHVLERKATKIIVFSLLYGAGVKHISEQLGVPYHEAAAFKAAYFEAFPEVKTLSESIKRIAKSGQPVRSWGGRLIFAEKSDKRDLSYKVLNHLIQGSAADQTKDAIIAYDKARSYSKFLLTVHDEICITAPSSNWKIDMNILRESMDNLPLDAPLASDGFIGPNYADVVQLEEA